MHEPFPFLFQLFRVCAGGRVSCDDHNPMSGANPVAEAVKNSPYFSADPVSNNGLPQFLGCYETKPKGFGEGIVGKITQNKKSPADGSPFCPDDLEVRAVRDPPGAGKFHFCEAKVRPARPGCLSAPTPGPGITCRVGRCDACIEVLLPWESGACGLCGGGV